MDSIILFPPGASSSGSQLQVGTWLMADPGADYGAAGLIQSIESSNALRDGGVFAYRSVGPRKMSIPLILRDVPSLTRLQAESLLRTWSTPGAYVAIQPEGVPSGEAVFFDVLDGRWEPAYDTFENRAARRKGTLFLDTQPWGYWPTEILLASAASVGWQGKLAINGAASIIGDVPPLAHIVIAPTVASMFPATANGFWQTDMIAYSLGAKASFIPFLTPSVFSAPNWSWTAASVADKFAPASYAWQLTITGGAHPPTWVNAFIGNTNLLADLSINRGRFRCFAFVRTSPSTLPWKTLVDSDTSINAGAGPAPAMASANQIATAYNVIPSISNDYTVTLGPVSASPAYSMLDMGEITLPAVGSGFEAGNRIRFWVQTPSTPGSQFSLFFGGLYLLPMDGPAGILPRGLYTPSILSPLFQATQGAVEWNNSFIEGAVTLGPKDSTGANPRPLVDGKAFFRGVTPRLGASTTQLLFITGDRLVNGLLPATYPVVSANVEYAMASVSYRPTFQFLHGL